MNHFRAPEEWLEAIEPGIAATLVASVSDIALVLDADGVIRDIAINTTSDSAHLIWTWLGRPWVDTVTIESRVKIEGLLHDAASGAVPRWRQVNHPQARGPDMPVNYVAVRLQPQGPFVASGRDLWQTAIMQQRLVDAQQSIDRHYSRLRQVETRYRLLFQLTAEAVLIVDARSRKILEANPAAAALLGEAPRDLSGKSFPLEVPQIEAAQIEAEQVEAAQVEAAQIETTLSAVAATGKASEIGIRLSEDERPCRLSVALFRQDNASIFLLRVIPQDGQPSRPEQPDTERKLLDLVAKSPDGLVLTADDGRILSANASFLDMVQLANEQQAFGRSLDSWLGRSGVDLNVLLANLRQHGTVGQFATNLRGEYGASADIEVSAVTLVNGGQPSFGFTIRNVNRRPVPSGDAPREMPRSVEQLTELVGRVPLKDLVRETTDLIERLCIEAALELTGDNRASAAEILGLSRQSLYVKLRRYGMADLGGEEGQTRRPPEA